MVNCVTMETELKGREGGKLDAEGARGGGGVGEGWGPVVSMEQNA